MDHWHPLGSLLKKFGTRILYDAASNMSRKRMEITTSASRDLQLIHVTVPLYRPDVTCEDTVRWTLTSNGYLTLKSAWNVIRESKTKVDWSNLVWHRD